MCKLQEAYLYFFFINNHIFIPRIERLRESGIYDELIKTALNPTRFGPDIGQTQPKNSHKFDVLNIKQMKGIFSLYLIFDSISIIIYLIESFKLINVNEKEQDKNSLRKQHLISWNTDKRGSYWMID